MGQSTDAILVYGVNFEEAPWEEFDEGETEKECEAAKLANPLGYMVWNGHAVDGVVIARHCSNDAPMYIVAAAGSELRAWRGSPRKVEGLNADPRWDAKLMAFLATHGVQTNEEPAWLLASDWS